MDKKNETSCTRTGNSIKDLGCFKMYFIDDCKSIFIVKNKINLKSKLYPSSEKWWLKAKISVTSFHAYSPLWYIVGAKLDSNPSCRNKNAIIKSIICKCIKVHFKTTVVMLCFRVSSLSCVLKLNFAMINKQCIIDIVSQTSGSTKKKSL